MIDLYNEKLKLEELIKSVNTSSQALDIKKLKEEKQKHQQLQLDKDFWQDQEKATKINQSIAKIEKTITKVETLEKECSSLSELLELAGDFAEEEFASEIQKTLSSLEKKVNALFIETLLTGKYDANNAILTLQAGAGGTEAQDWVEMLYRMYLRFAERQNFVVEELDLQHGDEAGIKSVTFLIKGTNAYGLLKAEKGVHRLVRISPFDSNKRRHTSFASLEVMPEIEESNEIIINPDDLKIDTMRSSGAGGQHVNKTESAVRITHIPTGTVTFCQNERSQIQNKATAMKMLISRLTELKERELEEQHKEIKGEIKKIEWGSQIRSYVFCPYTLVKDHRTNFENSNVNAVMDGDIEDFIYDYLSKANK